MGNTRLGVSSLEATPRQKRKLTWQTGRVQAKQKARRVRERGEGRRRDGGGARERWGEAARERASQESDGREQGNQGRGREGMSERQRGHRAKCRVIGRERSRGIERETRCEGAARPTTTMGAKEGKRRRKADDRSPQRGQPLLASRQAT